MPQPVLRLIAVALLAVVYLPVAQGQAPSIYGGGDGSSIERAVIVHAINEDEGIHAEHVYIRQMFPASIRRGRSIERDHNRIYDVLEFGDVDGGAHVIYFDATAFRPDLG